MVNAKKLESLLANLATYVGYLRELARTECDAFLHDSTKIGAAKYYLQVSIETRLNVGSHLIATENFRQPQDFRDVFTVLNENGILPTDFTLTLRRMAGLRNRLVHLYWEVDDAQIYADLQDHLGDFDRYVGYILAYVQGQGSQTAP